MPLDFTDLIPAGADSDDGDAGRAATNFERNKHWTRPGVTEFQTKLSPEDEKRFQAWVRSNKVPFEDGPQADYDMRGFWKASQDKAGWKQLQNDGAIPPDLEPAGTKIDPNDGKPHYPDYWKTPFHETFSNESQFALHGAAPRWNDKDQLVAGDGTVLFDDKAQKKPDQAQPAPGSDASGKPLPQGGADKGTGAPTAQAAQEPADAGGLSFDDLIPAQVAQPAPASAQPTGGIEANVKAGERDALGNVINTATDPFGNLIGKPLGTAIQFAHDALAPVFGYERFPKDVREMLLGDNVPQPGTRVVDAVSNAIGVPTNVTANTDAEQLARKVTGNALTGLVAGPFGALVGAASAVAGHYAGKEVPDWAQPATETAANVAAGAATLAAPRVTNALRGGRAAGGPGADESAAEPGTPPGAPPGAGPEPGAAPGGAASELDEMWKDFRREHGYDPRTESAPKTAAPPSKGGPRVEPTARKTGGAAFKDGDRVVTPNGSGTVTGTTTKTVDGRTSTTHTVRFDRGGRGEWTPDQLTAEPPAATRPSATTAAAPKRGDPVTVRNVDGTESTGKFFGVRPDGKVWVTRNGVNELYERDPATDQLRPVAREAAPEPKAEPEVEAEKPNTPVATADVKPGHRVTFKDKAGNTRTGTLLGTNPQTGQYVVNMGVGPHEFVPKDNVVSARTAPSDETPPQSFSQGDRVVTANGPGTIIGTTTKTVGGGPPVTTHTVRFDRGGQGNWAPDQLKPAGPAPSKGEPSASKPTAAEPAPSAEEPPAAKPTAAEEPAAAASPLPVRRALLSREATEIEEPHEYLPGVRQMPQGEAGEKYKALKAAASSNVGPAQEAAIDWAARNGRRDVIETIRDTAQEFAQYEPGQRVLRKAHAALDAMDKAGGTDDLSGAANGPWEPVGTNEAGQTIFQNPNGVHAVNENGVPFTEATKDGKPASVKDRSPTFKIAEPTAEQPVVKTEAPSEEPASKTAAPPKSEAAPKSKAAAPDVVHDRQQFISIVGAFYGLEPDEKKQVHKAISSAVAAKGNVGFDDLPRPVTDRLDTAQIFTIKKNLGNPGLLLDVLAGDTSRVAPSASPAPKVEEPKPAAPKPAAATPAAPKGRAVYSGSGRADQASVYNPNGAAVPIAGKGKYWAFTEDDAKNYGPNIETGTLDLQNPLVITSDDQWRALTKRAGWEFPNPFGQLPDKVEAATERLKDIVTAAGHDGVVFDWDDSSEGDIDDKTGDRIKTLRDVIGHPQAVDYRAKKAAPPAAKAEPKAEPASVESTPTPAAGATSGGFDAEKFDRERDDRIKASKAGGAVHVDQLSRSVEALRGKKISYVHGDEKGTITTVDNHGDFYVRWDSGPYAGSETRLTDSDAKDYAVLNPNEPYDPDAFAKQRKQWEKDDKGKQAPAAPKAKPPGAVMPPGDAYYPPVHANERLWSKSGREMSPVPNFTVDTNRAQNIGRGKLDAWLLDEARKEAAATGDRYLSDILSREDAKNFPPFSRDMAIEAIWGNDAGPKPEHRTAPAAPTPTAAAPPANSPADPAILAGYEDVAQQWEDLGNPGMAKAVRAGAKLRMHGAQGLQFQRDLLAKEKAKRDPNAPKPKETFDLDKFMRGSSDYETKAWDYFKANASPEDSALIDAVQDASQALTDRMNALGSTRANAHEKGFNEASRLKQLSGGLLGAFSRYVKGVVANQKGYKTANADRPDEDRAEVLADLAKAGFPFEPASAPTTDTTPLPPDIAALAKKHGIPTEGRTPQQVADDITAKLTPAQVTFEVDKLEKGRQDAYQEAEKQAIEWIVYHGTPHLFDRFDITKIGTGEGNQAYGWGLYFAEEKGIAAGYSTRLTARHNWDEIDGLYKQLDAKYQDLAKRSLYKGMPEYDAEVDPLQKQFDKAMQGYLYAVRIKVKPDEMLDWEKPVADQPRIMAAIERDPKLQAALKYSNFRGGEGATGENFYAAVGGTIGRSTGAADADRSRIASEYLLKAGIKGIRYLDAGSRRPARITRQEIEQIDAEIAVRRKAIADLQEELANNRNSGLLPRYFERMDKEIAGHQAIINEAEGKKANLQTGADLTRNVIVFDDKDVEITRRNGEPLAPEEKVVGDAPRPQKGPLAWLRKKIYGQDQNRPQEDLEHEQEQQAEAPSGAQQRPSGDEQPGPAGEDQGQVSDRPPEGGGDTGAGSGDEAQGGKDQGEVAGDPFAGREDQDVLRVTMKDGRTFTGSYQFLGRSHFIHEPDPSAFMGSKPHGPLRADEVASVEVVKPRAEVMEERWKRNRGERFPGEEPTTRDEYEARLTALADAVAAEPDFWRQRQLEKQFDDLADQIALAKTKRRWMFSAARFRLATPGKEPTKHDLSGGDMTGAEGLQRPRPQDFDPDPAVRRARAPLPEHVKNDPRSISNMLRALRRAGFHARHSIFVEPTHDQTTLIVDFPGGKEKGRFYAAAKRQPDGVMDWKVEPYEANTQAALDRNRRALNRPEYQTLQQIVRDGLPRQELADHGVTIFRSGANNAPDFRAYVEAGVPIGVSLARPLDDQMVIDYAKQGGRVFVDSGAFTEFTKGKKVDFPKVLDRYLDIANRAEGARLHFVMPDVIGDQGATLALIEEHADKINELIELGQDVLVPLQKGELTPHQVWQTVRDTLGTDDFTAAIPFFQVPFSDDDLRNLYQDGEGPGRIHLLGIAGRKKKLAATAELLRGLNPDIEISADANRISAGSAQGRPITTGRAENLAKLLEDLWNGSHPDLAQFDETELAGDLTMMPGFLSADQAHDLARTLGVPAEQWPQWVRAAEDGDLGDLLDDADGEGSATMHWLRQQFRDEAERVARQRARTDAVKAHDDATMGGSGNPAKAQMPAPSVERPQDASGNPIFKQGERVVIPDGQHAGRHGEIIKAEGWSWSSPFGGGKTAPAYHYDIRTDGGLVTHESKLEPEVGEAPQVAPDPVYGGHATHAVNLKDSIGFDKREERKAVGAEVRARTPNSKREHRARAEGYRASAAAKQAVLDAWIAAHPEEAQRLFPEAAPAAQGQTAGPVVNAGNGMTLVETTHGKTGEPLFVVTMAAKVPREQYDRLVATAKQHGGYYSAYRGRGAIPGFTFKAREDAEGFMQAAGGSAPSATPAEPSAPVTPPEPEPKHLTDMREALTRLKAQRFKSASDERLIPLYERRLAADPTKWSVGDGVSYQVPSGGRTDQTNRGFRIIEVSARDKQALLRSVADTGLTSTGGNNDAIEDQWQYLGELKHEHKYDAPADQRARDDAEDARIRAQNKAKYGFESVEQGTPDQKQAWLRDALSRPNPIRIDDLAFLAHVPVEQVRAIRDRMQAEESEAEDWWDKKLTGYGRRQVMNKASVNLPDRVAWRHISPENKAKLLAHRDAVPLEPANPADRIPETSAAEPPAAPASAAPQPGGGPRLLTDAEEDELLPVDVGDILGATVILPDGKMLGESPRVVARYLGYGTDGEGPINDLIDGTHAIMVGLLTGAAPEPGETDVSIRHPITEKQAALVARYINARVAETDSPVGVTYKGDYFEASDGGEFRREVRAINNQGALNFAAPAPTAAAPTPAPTPAPPPAAPVGDRVQEIERELRDIEAQRRAFGAAPGNPAAMSPADRARWMGLADQKRALEAELRTLRPAPKEPNPNILTQIDQWPDTEGTAPPPTPTPTAPPGITGTTTGPHPEWATDFEKEVGGRVVYSDPEVALLEGYGVLDGRPRYAGVLQDGRRTNVDIDAYTGKGFTPAQLAGLKAAKADVVARDQAAFEAHPDGPFAPGQKIAHSRLIKPSVVSIATEWLNMLGLGDHRVFIADPRDVTGDAGDAYNLNGPYAAIRSAGVDPTEGGSMRRLSNGDYYIALAPRPRLSATLETLAHEIGHIVEREMWKDAPQDVKDAVQAAFQKFLKDTTGQSAAEYVKNLRPHSTGKLTTVNTANNAENLSAYWRSFSEWFADQVARWATTDDTARTKIDQMFAKIGAAQKRLAEGATGGRYLPADQMRQWLNTKAALTDGPATSEDAAPIAAEGEVDRETPDYGDALTDDYWKPRVMTEAKPLVRSVSLPELLDIVRTGKVAGRLNTFNGFDRRRLVFFGTDDADTQVIYQGEEIDRQVQLAGLDADKAVAAAEARDKEAKAAFEADVDRLMDEENARRQKRGEKPLDRTADAPRQFFYPRVLKQYAEARNKAEAAERAARDAWRKEFNAKIGAEKQRRADQPYTSAVIRTKPLSGGLEYSYHFGNGSKAGMKGGEFGFPSGFVALDDIESVSLLKDGKYVATMPVNELPLAEIDRAAQGSPLYVTPPAAPAPAAGPSAPPATPKPIAAPQQHESWAPEVHVEGKWSQNATRFATKEEAEAAARDIYSRWMMANDSRAVQSTDPINYRWDKETGLQPVETPPITPDQESDDGVQDPLPPGDAGTGPGNVPGTGALGPDGRPSPGQGGGGQTHAPGPAGIRTPKPGRPAADGSGAGSGGSGAGDPDRVPGSTGSGTAGTTGRPSGPKGENYQIQPGALAESRGPMQKARDNLAAIELAQKIDSEARPATPDEQQVLAKYVGWGGLSGAFPNPKTGKFGDGLDDIGKRLKALLTPAAYDIAEDSTRFAHYTAEHVVRSMWDAVRQLGFTGGSVFEPGMGIGHFVGLMPPDLSDATHYRGLEMDPTTAQIARLLYPRSGVRQGDFRKTPLPEEAFDLVIGNPPFSSAVVGADPKYAPKQFMLHDYFFAKSLDGVRPGGLLAFITSAGTMNKMDDKARKFMAERAEFLGGVRLPNDAFRQNARTDVSADILFFRRHPEGKVRLEGDPPDWTQTVIRTMPNRVGELVQGHVNKWFSDHPETVLGDEGFFDELVAGEARYAVRPRKGGDLPTELAAALRSILPTDVMTQPQSPEERAAKDFDAKEKKDGSFYVHTDGRLMQYRDGAGHPVLLRGKEGGSVTKEEADIIRGLIPIRDALRDVFRGDLAQNEAISGPARKALNAAYDAFVKKYGPINTAEYTYAKPTLVQIEEARLEAREEARSIGEYWDDGDFDPSAMIAGKSSNTAIAKARQFARDTAIAAGRTFNEGTFDPTAVPETVRVKLPNIRPFMGDPESYRLRSIEKYDDVTGKGAKKDIFHRNILTFEEEPEIKSVEDGVLWSMNKLGRFDLDAIADKLGWSRGQVIDELGNKTFEVPNAPETYQAADEYLSGDVVSKLAEAKKAALSDPSFKRNVEALEAALPKPYAPSQIRINMGMPWIPVPVVRDFLENHLGLGSTHVSFVEGAGTWSVSGNNQQGHRVRSRWDKEKTTAGTAQWSTADLTAHELVSDALNRTPPKVYRTDPNDRKKTILDPVATQTAVDKVEEIKQAFRDWVAADVDRGDMLAGIFNDTLNRTVLRVFDGDYLKTPGIAAHWQWRPHQKRVIARIIQIGNTYMAHAVGAGKTSAMIAAGMEMRRLGLVKKPMYAVPNHMLAQFAKEFYEQYPTARIMVADERNFHTDRRKQFVANVATTDLDAVIITHSGFGKIPISAEFQDHMIREEVEKLLDAISQLDESKDRITVKKLRNRIDKLTQKMSKQGGTGKDQTFTFEEMGVDFLFVDEAHLFRKLSFATKLGNLKGIAPDGSDMAWDLYTKTRYLESQKPGRSLVMASGTPITNTMGELYTLSRYLQPKALAANGVSHFDSWVQTFADTKNALEQTPAGDYAPQTRLATFVNMPTLYKMVAAGMDIVTSGELDQYVTRPKLWDGGNKDAGQRQFVLAPRTEALDRYQQVLAQRVADIKARKGPPEKGDDILLTVINDGRHAAIDPRFVEQTQNDPNSKLNKMIDNVARIWGETKEQQFYYPANNYAEKAHKGPATQMIFANLGVNPRGPMNFSTYAWIKASLLRQGVPANEIAFIGDYDTHLKRQTLFNDMNEGKVRILIGSVQKMGTGVNAQRQLIAVHNLDPLWYPADDEQRNGRMLRQGNMNPFVQIYDYTTKGTYDAVMWDMMARKGRFIEQFFRGDPNLMEMEDLGEASMFEQAAGMATTDERVLQLTEMKQELDKHERRAQGFEREQYEVRLKIKGFESNIRYYTEQAEKVERDIASRADTRGKLFRMSVNGQWFDERKPATEALTAVMEDALKGMPNGATRQIGSIGGFKLVLSRPQHSNGHDVNLVGALSYSVSNNPAGTVASAESVMRNFEEKLADYLRFIKDNENQAAAYRPQLERKFETGDLIVKLKAEVRALEATLKSEAKARDEAAQGKSADENDDAEDDDAAD